MLNMNTQKRKKYRRYKVQRQKMISICILAVLIIAIIGFLTATIKLFNKDQKETTVPTKEVTTKATTEPTTETTTTKEVTTKSTGETTTTATKFDHSAWYLKLVNPDNKIDSTQSIELETLKNGYQCDKRIVDDLQQMMDDARAEGLNPIICSAYRSHERQIYLFNLEVESFKKQGYNEAEATKLAAKSAAVPGTSEHELGLSLDIVSASYQLLNDAQADTPEQKWLMANCYKYGFILRYPKEKESITKIMYEPWHYRYVGKEAAKIIYDEKICFEEFLDKY